jgi:hypothetical protein
MLIWILINILLPIVPIIIKYVVINMGKPEITKINLFEIPELLYLSIYYCIITLNINTDNGYYFTRESKHTGSLIFKLIILSIVVLNCIFLGMYYSNNIGDSIWVYLNVIIYLNVFIAIVFKIKTKKY